MAPRKSKSEIITFKAHSSLLDALGKIPNRSEFIRAAILSALENSCPLCGGTGFLTPEQKNHWEQFAADHRLQECDRCHEVHIVCEKLGSSRKKQPAPAGAK
jgi:hypothetical protein